MMVWHLMMVAWYVRGIATATGAVRNERARDLCIHGGIAAVYAVLGRDGAWRQSSEGRAFIKSL